MTRLPALLLILLLALSACTVEEAGKEQFKQLTETAAQQVVDAYAERCLRQLRLDQDPNFYRRGFTYSARFDGFVKEPGSAQSQERWTVTGPGLEPNAGGGLRVAPGTWRVVAGQRDPVPLNEAAGRYNKTIVELAYGANRPSGC